jgi:Cytochrome c
MVPVVIIAVIFTGLSAGIAWGASRGRLGGVADAMETQSRTGRRIVNVILVCTYVAFGVAIPIIFLVGNRDRASAQVGGVTLNSAEKQGRLLFGQHCAICHTLDAAAAVGKTGPNLDELQPSASLVVHTIQYGCLQHPAVATSGTNCLGYGTMPPDIVEGREAQEVAAFVSKVAGHA